MFLLCNLTGELPEVAEWPFVPTLARIGLAVAIGVFIGLEREHNKKTGVRTFALISLFACICGMLGTLFFVSIAIAGAALLIFVMNWQEIVAFKRAALTTSVAIMLMTMAGILCGQGHHFTPVVITVITGALLAWKQPIHGFAGRLMDVELRSAVMLAILTFIVLPALPTEAVDPWGLIDLRTNWASVILIATIGFVNYVLLKLLGPRGMELTAFLGGLLNSRQVIVELMGRLQELGAQLFATAYRSILLAMAAMVVRNVIIVSLISPLALKACMAPFVLMFLMTAVLWLLFKVRGEKIATQEDLTLKSPFRMWPAIKFGLVFLCLNVVGGLAQRTFGATSFYFVSAAGGLLSSASSIAAAANLIRSGEITAMMGVNGIMLASFVSIVVNIPIIRSMTSEIAVKRKITVSLLAIAFIGFLGIALNYILKIH